MGQPAIYLGLLTFVSARSCRCPWTGLVHLILRYFVFTDAPLLLNAKPTFCSWRKPSFQHRGVPSSSRGFHCPGWEILSELRLLRKWWLFYFFTFSFFKDYPLVFAFVSSFTTVCAGFLFLILLGALQDSWIWDLMSPVLKKLQPLSLQTRWGTFGAVWPWTATTSSKSASASFLSLLPFGSQSHARPNPHSTSWPVISHQSSHQSCLSRFYVYFVLLSFIISTWFFKSMSFVKYNF